MIDYGIYTKKCVMALLDSCLLFEISEVRKETFTFAYEISVHFMK